MRQTPHRQNGPVIRRMREERGIKPGEFAHRVGCARPTLTAIENGKSQASWELLHRIGHELGAPIERLLSDTGRVEHGERAAAAS